MNTSFPAQAGQTRPVGRSRRTGGIRARLLRVALGLILVALVMVTAAGLVGSRAIIRQAQQISSDSLRTQAESYLVQINASIAGQTALILDRAARDVQSVADAASAIYSGKVELPGTYVGMTVGPERQLMNSAADVSSVFVPSTAWIATDYNPILYRAVQRDIELSTYLDLTLPSIRANNPNAAAVYLGTVNDVLRYYPNIRLGEVVPADFQVTQRPWYLSAIEGNQDSHTPKPVWSPVYFDATGLGLVTTIAVPVRTDAGESIGVAGLDITLEEVQRNIEDSRFLKTGYSFLIDEIGNSIILPPAGYTDLLGRQPDPDQPTPNLLEETHSEALQLILRRMTSGEVGFSTIQLADREFYVAFTPVRSPSGGEMIIPGWSLASVVAANDVLANVATLQTELNRTIRQVILTRILPLGALIAMALFAAAWYGTSRMVNPILELAGSAERLGEGEWEEPVPVLRDIEQRSPDEIGLLAGTLAAMAGQLRQTFGRLEQRVSERTAALQHRSLQLQTASEVAAQITLTQDLDTLLSGAVDLISERFGYYTVGVFLVDDSGEYAHLKAAGGELGRRLLEREIRMAVGREGMVGYVTRFGKARITGDVREDPTYLAEPLLAGTRSELTLPLRTGPKIIGALDVQSSEINAFNEDDLVVLQAVADQLATAIENVRLVNRLQATLEETRSLVQENARQAWNRTPAGTLGYTYDQLEVKPLEPTATALASGHGALRVPVQLRGQVIGWITLESEDPDHIWTADELAVVEATANQAAVTVENARLLAESRRRAAREQITSEVTSRLRASLDMDTVLRSAVSAIAERLNLAEVAVELDPSIGPAEEGTEPADADEQMIESPQLTEPELAAVADPAAPAAALHTERNPNGAS